MKKNYLVIAEFKITSTTRETFQTGIENFVITANNKLEAINGAIFWCENIFGPTFEKNNINEKDYMNGCQVEYTTQITKIISVKVME